MNCLLKTRLLPVDLGKILNETFEKRQFGDYDVDADISEKEEQKVFDTAKMFVGKVKVYLEH